MAQRLIGGRAPLLLLGGKAFHLRVPFSGTLSSGHQEENY